MKKTARKYPRIVKILASVGVVIGFIGMLFISVQLLLLFKDMIFKPEAPPGVAPVLPLPVKGAIYVPFFYWILCIFIIAIVHEFAHGIVSAAYKIPIKSSGFAFLGLIIPVIPAAFVEPDEHVLKRRKPWEQLSVFAAGPFANIITAFLVLGIMFLVVNPIANSAYVENGVKIVDVFNNSAAYTAGMKENELITKVDNIEILNVENFTKVLSAKKPGDKITVTTNVSVYSVVLGSQKENPEKAFLGVSVLPSVKESEAFVKKFGKATLDIISWISGFFMWLYILNFGIGLFNLVPLGPIDGGRMLQVILNKFGKKTNLNSENADKLWKIISLIFFFIVLYMILYSFIR